jgi:hypothetical protein
MHTLHDIESISLKLSINQRGLLANHLFQSIQQEDLNDIDKAWLEEAEKDIMNLLTTIILVLLTKTIL